MGKTRFSVHLLSCLILGGFLGCTNKEPPNHKLERGVTMKARSKQEANGEVAFEGIIRRTLSYNDEMMLCHFIMKEGGKIPLHDHRASQIGYVVSGSVRFLNKEGEEAFIASTGDSYVFDPYQVHGAEALEDSELIETFYPPREEYKDF